MSDADLARKFHGLVDPVLGAARAARLIERAGRWPALTDVEALTAAATPNAEDQIERKTMPLWARVNHEGRDCFGTIDGDSLRVHAGDMFARAAATGKSIALDAVELLTPTVPGKMVALSTITTRWSRSSATRCRRSRFISSRPAATFSRAARRSACRSRTAAR